jgi:squalene-hopene/tetraprenyl-beta-curcumene cyclase
MQLPFDPTQLARIVTCDQAFEQLRVRWLAGVDWRANDRRESRRIYEMYPLLFAPAFRGIPEQTLGALVVACRLLAEALFAFDEVIDEPIGARDRATGIAKGQSLQLEAIRAFAGVFPPASEFWDALHGHFIAYTAAIQQEHQLPELDESTALELARGKTAVAHTCIAAMGILSARPDVTATIIDAVREYYVARQMWDDLADWRKDLARGQRSLLLTRAFASLGSDSARDGQSVGVAIYYGGHAEYVLALGGAALERALAVITSLNVPLPFGLLLGQLAKQFAETRAGLLELIDRKRRTPGAHPHALPAPPDAMTGRLDLVWSSARQLAVQAPRAFGEARHWLKFGEGTLRSRPTQAGDVFQRAVIADVLCDLPAPLAACFEPVLAHEVTHLMESRVCATCGWNYLPELDELPADCDTLAQVLQLAVRRGFARSEDFDGPLATAFGQAHRDGSFETWILPSTDVRDAVHQHQAELVERVWGTGPDPEVMANLLYALALWDSERFADRIVAGCQYIVRAQRADGRWTGRWYVGTFYPTYAAVRLLAQVRDGRPAIERAVQTLLADQQPTGAWSRDEAARPLDTAHALLALLATRPLDVAAPTVIHTAVTAGLDALRRMRRPDGSWAADPFLSMPEQVWGSTTMTTAYVLKAAALAEGV